jgi:hypothetical protein
MRIGVLCVSFLTGIAKKVGAPTTRCVGVIQKYKKYSKKKRSGAKNSLMGALKGDHRMHKAHQFKRFFVIKRN